MSRKKNEHRQVKPLNQLRDLRILSEMRQVDLCNALDISPYCYSQIERGIRDADASLLCKLADFFDTTTDYILGRTKCRARPLSDYLVDDEMLSGQYDFESFFDLDEEEDDGLSSEYDSESSC